MEEKRQSGGNERHSFAEKMIKFGAKLDDVEEERNKVLNLHYEIILFKTEPLGCDDSQALEYS